MKRGGKKEGGGRRAGVGTCSTFAAVLALVSRKRRLFSFAKAAPSSVDTCLLFSKSHLFPISIITMLEFEYLRQSSSQDVRCSKVSRLRRVFIVVYKINTITYRVMSYVSKAPKVGEKKKKKSMSVR